MMYGNGCAVLGTSRLAFQLHDVLKVGNHDILFDPEILICGGGIRRGSKLKACIGTFVWPLLALRGYFLVDGFVTRQVGKLVKKHLNSDTALLDLGCGDMRFRKFVPAGYYYNAFDISLSEFHLRRVLSENHKVNVALASATKIPLACDTVSVIVATEVFEHIRGIDEAMHEIYRVLKPGGICGVSMPNNYCYKYKKKGPHADHVNSWTFDGFKQYVAQHGFQYLEGFMKGWWIPLPLWLSKTSYQLPISHRDEFYNTNFFFVFRKPDSV